MIKEPAKTSGLSVHSESYRDEGLLRTLFGFYYDVHTNDSIPYKKITKQHDLTIFPKQLVLIGQYNPVKTLACNETSFYNKFVDTNLILQNLTPKVRKHGYEKMSTSPAEKDRASKMVKRDLKDAINMYMETKETPEILKAHNLQGYVCLLYTSPSPRDRG